MDRPLTRFHNRHQPAITLPRIFSASPDMLTTAARLTEIRGQRPTEKEYQKRIKVEGLEEAAKFLAAVGLKQ